MPSPAEVAAREDDRFPSGEETCAGWLLFQVGTDDHVTPPEPAILPAS